MAIPIPCHDADAGDQFFMEGQDEYDFTSNDLIWKLWSWIGFWTGEETRSNVASSATRGLIEAVLI